MTSIVEFCRPHIIWHCGRASPTSPRGDSPPSVKGAAAPRYPPLPALPQGGPAPIGQFFVPGALRLAPGLSEECRPQKGPGGEGGWGEYSWLYPLKGWPLLYPQGNRLAEGGRLRFYLRQGLRGKWGILRKFCPILLEYLVHISLSSKCCRKQLATEPPPPKPCVSWSEAMST
jgi:hypothetical protein